MTPPHSELSDNTLNQAILDSANFSIISTDPAGVILSFNRAAEHMLGYTAAEIIGKTTPALFHDGAEVVLRAQEFSQKLNMDIPPGFEVFVAHSRLDLPNEFEWTYIHKDGSRFPVLLSISALKNSDQQLIGFLGMARDITLKKTLEKELLTTKENLLASARQYQAIFDNVVDGIIIIDAIGIIQSANRAAETIFGYSLSNMLGQNVKMLMPSPYHEEHEQYLKNYRDTGQAKIIGTGREVVGRRQDGSIFPLELAVSEVYIGEKQLFTGLVRDISERKQNEMEIKEREEHIKQIMESMPIAIFVADRHGVPYYANQMAIAMLGQGIFPERHEAVTAEIYQVYVAGSENLYPTEKLPLIQALSGKKTMVNDIEIHRGDRIIPVQVWGYPIFDHDGKVLYAISTFVDITDHIESEKAQKQAVIASDQANQAKSQFLANMSHELRTPLNAIIGYSEMLQEDVADQGLTELVPDLQKISLAGKHLLSLINDILDLSKIEAGMMELFPEEVDIDILLQNIVATVEPLVKKNHNTFQIEIIQAENFLTDVTKLRQILFNLISNAAKFTKNGNITLSVSKDSSLAEEWLNFAVKDTGIGISPEQQEKLFKSFSQVDASTTRNYGGTGLGLAISQSFALMMGGKIVVESVAGSGATFTLKLPIKVNVLGPISAPTNVPNKPTKGLVLVIDDDLDAQNQLKESLLEAGFRVSCASSGEQGLSLAKRIHPDLITLELLMSPIDGWDVLQRLKDDPELKDIPVILISNAGSQNMGFALGAVDYLIKPIDSSNLVSSLQKHLLSSTLSHILIVEDDRYNRELLARMVQKEGYRVREATNGKEALQQIAAEQPDLILLDLMMPEMNGFELVAEIQKNKAWASIPVIVVTAKDITPEERKQLNGYVQYILNKGTYSQSMLIEQVNSWITHINSHKEHEGNV